MKHAVQEVKLKNGARGLLIDVPGATTMSMEFCFRAGHRYAKTKEIEQVPHIMEHIVASGVNARYKSSADFEFEFTKNGAYRNAFTGGISMVYESDCADFEWDRILDLQKIAICQPLFREKDLIAEKGNVRNELTNYLNNYQRILYRKVQQSMGEDVLTYQQALKTISNISIEDIKEHHRRTHITGNMRFVIAGKLKGRKAIIKKQIESFCLPQKERFDYPKDELIKPRPFIIRRKDASNLTFDFFLAVPRSLTDEESDAVDCLNHILTGTMHSRIFGKARSRGLAYNINAYSGVGFYDSGWGITGEVNHEDADALFGLIVREMKRVLTGQISEKEVEAAKSFALGRHQMDGQTVSQISNFYSSRYYFDDFIKNYEKVPEMIKGVTVEKMVNLANEFFSTDTWSLAAVSGGERQEIIDLAEKVGVLFKEKEVSV